MSSRAVVLFLVLLAFPPVIAAKNDNWVEVRNQHFVVLTNAGEKQARHTCEQFERMRAVFHKRFPSASVDAASPIIVIAVKDKKDFQALEPEAYLAKGQLELAGLFLQGADKNYVLLRLDTEGPHPYATVYHEYTHFIVRRAGNWLPLWLNEGWAQFYENTEINDKVVSMGEPSPENLMLLRQNRLLPLKTLLAVDHNSPYYHEENKGSIFYAESWALTHYLTIKDRQDNTDKLTDYVKLVSTNVDPVTAATRAFGDLTVLEKNLGDYVSHASFYYFKMPGALEIDETAFQTEELSAAKTDAIRADFLAYNERAKDARALLDRVLKDDPNSAAAHETMGFLAFREGNLDEAGRWYEEAVKLDSQSFLAHYYFAAIAMRKGPSSDRNAQIEASFRTAIKLNPSFAPAFDDLSVFFAMQHENLDEAAMLNLNAISLEPSNIGYRVNRANLMMEMQRPKDAVAVLQAAMKLTDKAEERGQLEGQLQSVERYQAAVEAHAQQIQEVDDEADSAEDSKGQEVQPATVEEPTQHGPRRSVNGTLRNIQCSYPSTITMKVESGKNQLPLRAVNFYKVAFTASNFAPKSDLNPCKDLDGMTAKVDYFEGIGEGNAGQIISIELSK
jgi:tetratricopeptide (TPR) repeat protein